MSLNYWTTKIRISHLTILLKFRSKVPLKKLRYMSLCVRRGPWWFQSRLRGWLRKQAARCLQTLIWMSKEQQQLHKELYGYLLTMVTFYRRRGIFPSILQCLISSSHLQGLVHRHLYWWTQETMIQMTCLYFKRKDFLLKSYVRLFFFVNFLVGINIFIFLRHRSNRHQKFRFSNVFLCYNISQISSW